MKVVMWLVGATIGLAGVWAYGWLVANLLNLVFG